MSELAAENARLRARVERLTPLAIAGLRRGHPEEDSEEAALLEELLAELERPRELSTLLPLLISDLSEEAWCAGWLSGCEFELWARVTQYREHGSCNHWGLAYGDELTAQVARLSEASYATNTWAVWVEAGDIPVSVEEWLETYWPKAPKEALELAEKEPECGEPGNMVARKGGGWPVIPFCHLKAGHGGEHAYNTDED